jgi:putative cell wall-binding protein
MKLLKIVLINIMILLSINLTNAEHNIILVSDNPADNLTALSLANIGNYDIIYTKWGIYDDKIIQKIKYQHPNKVYIIGGPKAVPTRYRSELSKLNIDIHLLYGEDRIKTNKVVSSHILHYENITNRSIDILITNGYNINNDKIKSVINNNTIVILSNENKSSINESLLLNFNAKSIHILDMHLKAMAMNIKSTEKYYISKYSNDEIILKKEVKTEYKSDNLLISYTGKSKSTSS